MVEGPDRQAIAPLPVLHGTRLIGMISIGDLGKSIVGEQKFEATSLCATFTAERGQATRAYPCESAGCPCRRAFFQPI